MALHCFFSHLNKKSEKSFNFKKKVCLFFFQPWCSVAGKLRDTFHVSDRVFKSPCTNWRQENGQTAAKLARVITRSKEEDASQTYCSNSMGQTNEKRVSQPSPGQPEPILKVDQRLRISCQSLWNRDQRRSGRLVICPARFEDEVWTSQHNHVSQKKRLEKSVKADV